MPMDTRGRTLADRMHAAGIDPTTVLAHRITLHRDDGDGSYRTTEDLARAGHALTYQRIQDGAVFGPEALVAGFVAQDNGTALFADLRRLVARRPGIAPGDIIYDPDIAHVLHNFISRATAPTFYDAFEDARANRFAGIILRWPDDAADLLPATDVRLMLIAETE